MRPRTLLLVGLAIILAVGTAMLARSWLAAQRNSVVAEAAPAAPRPANQVLVARNDITRGQILRPQDLAWLPWPAGGVDHNYIVEGSGQGPEKFAGWVAVNPISGGEPISTSKIVAPGDRGYLAAVLQPGMRAISVPVTLTSGISGLVFPGDRVDLLMTFNVPQQQQDFGGDNAPRQANFDHKATETVLRNIRVIAIDQRLDSKAGEAVLAHTATFEVSPKQSEVIALASELGRVSLTLRSLVAAPQDPAASEEKGPGASDTMATDSAIGDHATYTVDSEISPLLPKVSGSTQSVAGNVVTILRGTAKASEFRAPESAPKGS
jgi:pilus assembly protein CpaB